MARRSPLRLSARVCLAHGYGRVGRRKLSYDLLLNLIDAPQIPVSLLLQVAIGLDQVDRPDVAVVACRRATELDPESAQAQYDVGYYIGRCGGPICQVESFARRAISLAPHAVEYRTGLAGLLLQQDRRDEAYELVCNLSNQEIESIGCVCCLRRVADLFERAHDYRRLVVVQQHMVLIENTRETDHGC